MQDKFNSEDEVFATNAVPRYLNKTHINQLEAFLGKIGVFCMFMFTLFTVVYSHRLLAQKLTIPHSALLFEALPYLDLTAEQTLNADVKAHELNSHSFHYLTLINQDM